jgi:hypothetical protein
MKSFNEGVFFVGPSFRYILNHFRGGNVPPGLRLPELTLLRAEAVFYDLISLVVEIDEMLLARQGRVNGGDEEEKQSQIDAADIVVAAAGGHRYRMELIGRFGWAMGVGIGFSLQVAVVFWVLYFLYFH